MPARRVVEAAGGTVPVVNQLIFAHTLAKCPDTLNVSNNGSLEGQAGAGRAKVSAANRSADDRGHAGDGCDCFAAIRRTKACCVGRGAAACPRLERSYR